MKSYSAGILTLPQVPSLRYSSIPRSPHQDRRESSPHTQRIDRSGRSRSTEKQFASSTGTVPQQSPGSHPVFNSPYTQNTLTSQYSRPDPLQPHNGNVGQIPRSSNQHYHNNYSDDPSPARNKDRSRSPPRGKSSQVVRRHPSQGYRSPAQDLDRRRH
jgi:hypothetical protein